MRFIDLFFSIGGRGGEVGTDIGAAARPMDEDDRSLPTDDERFVNRLSLSWYVSPAE